MNPRRAILLDELLKKAMIVPDDVVGNPRVMVTGISTNARRTGRNEMFVAVRGTKTDSHMLLSEAVDAGASVLLVDRREVGSYPGVTIVCVADTRQAIGPIAHAFHNNPARSMIVCGVTGTNGKTSTTHFIYRILAEAGRNPGVIGTLGAFHGGHSIPLHNTTPGAQELAEIFHKFDLHHVDSVIMECSSHAIDQGRINGIPFRCGALTNITQDHLDYHGSFNEYMNCKERFFAEHVAAAPGSVSCFNMDDESGVAFSSRYRAEQVRFSTRDSGKHEVVADEIVMKVSATEFRLRIENRKARINTSLVGSFNISNMLAAAACAHSMGIGFDTIAGALEKMSPVPGRFEIINEGQPFTVIVDYAHTPDALERVLRFARQQCASGRMLVAFGCGGDRDRGKRPIMGKVAGDQADFVIITSDNPRTEDPSVIARQVLEGLLRSKLKSNRYYINIDRGNAIEMALTMASPGDVVVIAGKGHEDYQDVGTKRIPFDDRIVARTVLKDLVGNFTQMESLQTFREPIA
ncbi:UDP-N-acetylmuramoyl-L-alanyl-D-glutamate--2,6-diaminopimelate ligase [Candidatus Sumerlaeota bacterium]|nr:UDP-N-acetylmuramoyl-L-alanyl-D-glutamate--2,6-diaminopimelate ligase [Candidatus Sumerlaeota bacterium]